MAHRYSEALGVTDAGLAVIPNFVPLYIPRTVAENSLGRFEQARVDAQRAMRLSPRDPLVGVFHVDLGEAEMGLGHFDVAIEEFRKAIDSGFRPFYAYTNLAAAYAHAGKMDEAKVALAEARRLNPSITIKWLKEHTPNLPVSFDGLRKVYVAKGRLWVRVRRATTRDRRGISANRPAAVCLVHDRVIFLDPFNRK